MGLDALLEEYPVPVYVHEAEKGLIADPKTNLSLTYTNGYVFEDATYVTDGQKIAAAGVTFEVLFTPGHTSVSYTHLKVKWRNFLYESNRSRKKN